jgi:ATP-binding cassette, subfamily B, multidrug efflux pump
MTTHFEEDLQPSSTALLNREVVRLLFSYLLRYRRHLLVAVVFVGFITGARLLVPFISGYVVDHFLVKKGYAVRLDAPGMDASLRQRLRRETALDDSTVFLFRNRLGRLSAPEIECVKRLSPQQWLLVEPPAAVPETTLRKLEAGVRSGQIRRCGRGQYLFSDAAPGRFTAAEMIVLRSADWHRVAGYVLLVVGLFLIQFVASYFQIIALMKLSQSAMRDLRQDLYRHLLSLELKFFDKNPVGRLVNRVTNDIETLNEMFSTVAVALFQDIVIMAGIVIVMLCTDVRLSLVVCSTLPFLAAITIVFRNQARSAYRNIRTRIAGLNAFLNENITGIRITQIFGSEARQLAKFRDINHGVYSANLKQLKIYAVFRPLIDFFRWAAVAGVILFGSQMLVHAGLSYGIIVMFLAYIAGLFEPLGDLAEKFDVMQSANAAGEKILSAFKADAVREIDKKDIAGPFPARRGGGRFRGEVRFEDVWCAYSGTEWVLRGISFAIPPRSTLAIVGETGSGKSTIISLLGRLYPWQKGRITVDNMDLADIPYNVLRSQTAAVMQEMFLFSRSVRENLTLGAPFDEKRWNEAIRVTHVDRLLERLPEGAATAAMERGVALSAGERQLCAFARALYADPAILVLDEATSSIDSETESLIQDALRRLLRDRTSIVIAHRLSTVRSADRIIVLDKGTIAEEGDHASLLARKGLYYELYKLQFEAV